MMNFLPENIDQYVVNHSQKEPQVLHELSKETWQKVLNPRMLSGAFQGRVLSMISKIIQPKKVLEIGTYTGYSAICMAEGLRKGGIIHTIDKNEELEDIQNKYFIKSGLRNQIQQHYGNALELIPKFKETFDMIFIDADKSNYSNYFNLLINKLRPGGIILSDNVLWSGKVISVNNNNDLETEVLKKFNKKLSNHKNLETVLLPVRDGISLSMKI